MKKKVLFFWGNYEVYEKFECKLGNVVSFYCWNNFDNFEFFRWYGVFFVKWIFCRDWCEIWCGGYGFFVFEGRKGVNK